MRHPTASVLVLSLFLLAPGSAAWSADASPGPAPSAGVPATHEPGPPTAAVASFADPVWSRVRTDGGPAAREDHTWTVAADGRHAYLFGGRDGGRVFGDFWVLDLETDAWEKLVPRGARPAARFGHNAAWVDGQGLVVFAGQRGTDFFDDLWAFDPVLERWTALPSSGAVPRARYGSCMVVDGDDRLVISHGFTFSGRFDDTRAYDPRRGRWVSVAPEGRRPGQRCLHDCFTSTSGGLVLFGGQDDEHVALGDLWRMRADGSWRRMPDPPLRARRLYALTQAGGEAWIFGGVGRDNDPMADLWRIDRDTLSFTRVDIEGATPGGRFGGTLITDAARGRLLLFGGMAREALADLWQLTDRAGQGPHASTSPPSTPPSSFPSPSPGEA
jgi:Galactose oxidase, central domain